MEFYQQVEHSLTGQFRKSIWKKVCQAVDQYALIQEGDRVAVCISGGKDSMLLAKCLQELQRRWQVKFHLEYIAMDPGYRTPNRQQLEQNAAQLHIPLHLFDSPIFRIVEGENNPCYLCARMRRGYLYEQAAALGCNKIALGHHFDDVVETILMGMLYGSQLQTMMPKLHSTNHPGMELIRPLYHVKEADILRWRDAHGLCFLQCACRISEAAAAGDAQGSSKRQEVKQLIAQLRRHNPNIDSNIFRSIHHVNLDTLISYQLDGKTHDFLERYDRSTVSNGQQAQP